MHTLEGRAAIVTGGSRSVGYGIAAGRCEAGATRPSPTTSCRSWQHTGSVLNVPMRAMHP